MGRLVKPTIFVLFLLLVASPVIYEVNARASLLGRVDEEHSRLISIQAQTRAEETTNGVGHSLETLHQLRLRILGVIDNGRARIETSDGAVLCETMYWLRAEFVEGPDFEGPGTACISLGNPIAHLPSLILFLLMGLMLGAAGAVITSLRLPEPTTTRVLALGAGAGFLMVLLAGAGVISAGPLATVGIESADPLIVGALATLSGLFSDRAYDLFGSLFDTSRLRSSADEVQSKQDSKG